LSSDLPVISNPLDSPLLRAGEQFERTVRSKSGTDEAGLRKAASEFESLFVSYLLKVMRETIDESTAEGSGFGRQIYTELFDQEVARGMAQRGVLGIGDMVVHRLESAKSAEPDTPASSSIQPSAGAGEDIPDFQLPVHAPVSSAFGMRRDPFTHQMKAHKGIDIAAPEGTAVQAALGGEVVSARYEYGYGNTVVLRHAGGMETRYAHLGSISVREGEQVASQTVLGSVGSTGRSTGPHLHFEVIDNGRQINPEEALTD
jgi:murein DD-endopeptidase MepM/ murein hydrolase activator NlpD